MGKDGPARSIAGKTSAEKSKQQDSQASPGPGSYDPNFGRTLKAAPSTSIGHSRRDDYFSLKNSTETKADPFSYNPSLSFTKAGSTAWGFGTSSRQSLKDLDRDSQTRHPGP